MKSVLTAALSFVLVVLMAVPLSLVIAPAPRAEATSYPDMMDFATDVLNYAETYLTEAAASAQEELQYYMYIKEYVLEPLAFIQGSKATQSITGGILAFVSGQSNGTGQAQFVQDLPGYLRKVGDNSQRAFVSQLRQNSNAPYMNVIAASLESNYNEQSTVGGFFAANRNTLPQYSPDPQAYLQGNWSKGGINAWFALTTQSNNNPYLFAQAARGQLALVVSTDQADQARTLDWGQGFLSWCGADDTQANNNNDAGKQDTNKAANTGDGSSAENPTEPGAVCTTKDGKLGKIQTPGSTISRYLDKALTLDADKVNKMGNAATQISDLIGSLMDTVQMAQTALGGSQGGLAGVGSGSGSGGSLIDQYNGGKGSGYGSLSQCSINETMAKSEPTNGQQVLDRIDMFLASWEQIGVAAQTASTSVTYVRDICAANAAIVQARIDSGSSAQYLKDFVAASTKLATDAQYNIENYIAPSVEQAAAAPGIAAAAQAYIVTLRANLNAPGVGDPPVCTDYSSELNTLRDMRPTARDNADAQKNALGPDSASTSPERSLAMVKTQGTLIGKLVLMNTNAVLLKNACLLPY